MAVAVALAVVLVTSRWQRSVGSSVGGAAKGTRCDDWLRPPYYYYSKNSARQKCSAHVLPGALFFAPGSAFLLPGALVCSGVLFFAGITPPVSTLKVGLNATFLG